MNIKKRKAALKALNKKAFVPSIKEDIALKGVSSEEYAKKVLDALILQSVEKFNAKVDSLSRQLLEDIDNKSNVDLESFDLAATDDDFKY